MRPIYDYDYDYDYDDETRLFVLDHEEPPYAQLHPEEELDEELLLELAHAQQMVRRCATSARARLPLEGDRGRSGGRHRARGQ